MDFFTHQDRARKNTGKLVVLFGLGVLAISALVYVLVLVVVGGLSQGSASSLVASPLLPVGAITATSAVIGLSSLGKIAQLASGGGAAVARSVGGRLLTANTADQTERRLLNIVEEMAIASGIPAPPVYIMDNERQINAFAAGFRPESAVIGVTRGCAEQLTRDELQGVVAHEFAHIFNGDMRLNIKLIGWIHGLMVLSLIGNTILRSSRFSVGSSRKSEGQGGIMLLGLGLVALGGVGFFVGRLIQSAVSRQREFLADASAVQFTRNPKGLADALKRIASIGSAVKAPAAEEVAHLFFGSYAKLGGAFATHPPILERIRRLAERAPADMADAPAPTHRAAGAPAPTSSRAGAAGLAALGTPQASALSAAHEPRPTTTSRQAMHAIGRVEHPQADFATSAIGSLPAGIRQAAMEPFSAVALLVGIVLSPRSDVAARQREIIRQSLAPGILGAADRLLPAIDRTDPALRLPAVDLLLPTLHALSDDQRAGLIRVIESLIEADHNVDVYEWALHRIVSVHLRGGEQLVKESRRAHLASEAQSASAVLAALASMGNHDDAGLRAAFDRGREQLQSDLDSLGTPAKLPPASPGMSLRDLDQGLRRLQHLPLAHKRAFIHACAATVLDDDQVTVAEAEVLRACADTLGVPVPPLVLDVRPVG